jgi:hypothetical protein
MDDFPGIMRIKGFRDLQPHPPTTLYHYTTPSGLIGILDEEAIWATHGRFLNDQSEFKFGKEQIHNSMFRAEKTFGVTHPLHFRELRRVLAEDESISNFEPIYVASFTERRDHVSQWERYSGRHGYAIGFNASEMWQLARKQGLLLLRMLYQKKQQQQAFDAVLAEIFARANKDVPLTSHRDTEKNERESMHRALTEWAIDRASSLWIASLSFKDRSFAEEREWRLMIYAEDEETKHVRFRAGRLGIIPYLTSTIRGAGESWLITELMVGTTNYREDSELAIRLALQKVDLSVDTVRIRHSTVPLRV